MNKNLKVLICPNCKESLSENDRCLACPKGHSFDLSKEGYANLLLPNQKKTKHPGDNEQMIKSRKNFLDQGYFCELRKTISEVVDFDGKVAVDAGCGTGYYLQSIADKVSVGIGVDISKEAIKIASKNIKNALFIVASIFSMPIKDASVDYILNVFSPKPEAEFERILKKGGIVIEVVPGQAHLKELKEKLYESKFRFNSEKYAFKNLELIKTQRLLLTKQIKNENDCLDLLKMTPYSYKSAQKELLLPDQITFDFIINLWRKHLN